MALSNSAKRAAGQASVLLVLALALGAARQFVPGGISWQGRWPTSETSAGDAYKMMAQPTDPPFASMTEALELHRAGAIFLDGRSKEEFAAGRIPAARSLPFYELESHKEAALAGTRPDTTMVIYCEGVGCELSLFLARELQPLGYTNLKVFYGGFPEWKNAGLPVEK